MNASSETFSKAWANRLVAKWCEQHAVDREGRKLVACCNRAYKNGPMVEPVRKFADALAAQVARNEAEWIALALEFRAAADEEDRKAAIHATLLENR